MNFTSKKMKLFAFATLFCFSSSTAFVHIAYNVRSYYGPIQNHRAVPFDNNAGDDLVTIPSDGRRNLLKSFVGTFIFELGIDACSSLPTNAVDAFEKGLLESRVTENLMSKVPYGLEGPDLFYPAYFKGVWDVKSVTKSVEAPCGPSLFGGNSTFSAAQAEVGPENALRYRARFTSQNEGTVIADREFNVAEIVRASMGNNAVLNIPVAEPNKFCCLLAPSSANTMFNVDTLTVARRQENISDRQFDCSELVRQIVSIPSERGGSGPNRKPRIKDIEAISLYEAADIDSSGRVNEIRCSQRVATFIAPIPEDPLSMQLWQYSRGRPIDVRFYDLTYRRKGTSNLDM